MQLAQLSRGSLLTDDLSIGGPLLRRDTLSANTLYPFNRTSPLHKKLRARHKEGEAEIDAVAPAPGVCHRLRDQIHGV